MEYLSDKQKVALAKQFNLIVRAISDFQLTNWGERNKAEFDTLFHKERELLLHVEHLLNRGTILISDDPSGLVIDVENFGEDLRMQLKYCNLNTANELISRSLILASSIFGFAPNFHEKPQKKIAQLYVA